MSATAPNAPPTRVKGAGQKKRASNARLVPRARRNVAKLEITKTSRQVSRQVKAGATRAVEIPSGPSSAELLETFAQTLEDVFEKADDTTAVGERGGRAVYAEDDSEWLTREEVADLAMKVEVLANGGLMRSVPPGAVVRLLDVLDKHVARADDVDVREDDDERSANARTVMRALDCASLALRVLGAEGMPKEVYREESIEKLVDFVRHQANRNVFAFYDASYYQIHRGEKVQQDAEDEQDAEEPASPRSSKKSPSKRGKKAATKNSSSRRQSGAIGVAVSRKTFVDPPRVARKMHDVLAGILTKIARLLYTIHLPDATVLQLTSLGVSALQVDGVDLMQARAVDVVVAAFKQYPEHRSLILDNLLVALLKLPTTGRHLRRYMLPEDDAKSVQAISAMLMQCVQISVTFEEEPSEIAGKADSAGSASGYGPAFQWSHYFWKELLRGWHSARAQEIDIKALMQNLMSDLLTALNMPEWPVASLMLLSLCAQLLSSHGINSPEIRVRELAMDFLGQVAARIKEDTAACEREKTWTDLFAGDDGDDGEDAVAPETLSAFDLAQQDAADARSFADAADMQVTASGRGDALVLEAMLLRHIRQVEARSQAPGRAEGSAFTFALAQLSREAERRGVGFRSGGTGPGGDRETYKSLAGVLQSSEDADAAAAGAGVSGGANLPRELAICLFRSLQQQLPLARQLHILVERLLGSLEDPAITVRAAAVRALAAVVDADPRVLEWEQVRAAVRRRMSDNGTMVRSAVIDLLGKHVARDSRVAETYYPAIVERISDVGVSVRKRVIHILHDCIRSSSMDFKHSVEALRFLAFRILDDDVGIQELVARIFRELWFSPPAAPAHRAGARVADPTAERAEQLVAVLWEVYCGVSRVGYAKLPLLSTFPIVAILRRVVFPSDEDAAADEARGDFAETVSTARRLCGAILDGMLSQEEAEASEETKEKDLGTKDMSSFPRALRYALGLHVFCATDPQLCVAEGNPLGFAAALHPYIKRAENTSANSLQLQCCISVVDAVVKESGCLSAATAAEIEKDLRFLLLRNTFHGVLYYASRCICSVAETAAGGDVASGALQISRRFVKLLDEVSERDELSASERAHVSRALFVLGHLARFGADTLEASREEAVSPSNLLRLFRCFLQRATPTEFDLKRGALQACGFLFVARPQLMLCPKGGFGKGSMDGIMRAALGSFAERNLKEQALLNLDEYLREEEIRTLIQMSDDVNAQAGAAAAAGGSRATVAAIAGAGGALSRAKRRRQADAKRMEASDAAGKKGESFQTINGEHDNSLANGVAQRYWSFVVELCTDPEPSVRLKALHLAEVVLRQGLVHPMSCFPPLIALQADPVLTVRKLAMRLLRQQHGKYPDFFDHQLGAGLGLLFEFCKRLQAAARRAARAKGRGASSTGNARNAGLVASAAVVNQGFTNIYKLVNGARSARFKFLRALLRRYEGESSGSDVTYLCFLANAVGALPFTMSDEALFVIFHLNRIISLRASTLQDSLAARVARAEAAGDADPPADLRNDIEASLSASIVLSLKRHLKLTYDLTDARTRAYNPAEPLKSAEAFRYDEDASELDLSWCDPAAGATVAGCRAQADLFARLMQSDADDYGEYAPASRKRGRPKKTRAVDDDDDSDDSDDDDEPFSPAIPKTASIASPRGSKGTPRGKRARRGGSSTPTPRKRLAL